MQIVWLYQRFERFVAHILLIGMIGVIVLATWSFFRTIWTEGSDLGAPLDYKTFQTLFDRVLAAIIALELAHSVQQMALGDHRLAQVKTVIVIGILAVVRKLILLEVQTTSGLFLAGIAATVIALGAALVMVHWIDSREESGLGTKTTGRTGEVKTEGPAPRRDD